MSHWLRANAGATNNPRRNVGILSANVTNEKIARMTKRTADIGVIRQGLCRISRRRIDVESSLRGSILVELVWCTCTDSVKMQTDQITLVD